MSTNNALIKMILRNVNRNLDITFFNTVILLTMIFIEIAIFNQCRAINHAKS